jgi:hypothetical protein
MADPSQVKRYTERAKTRFEHQWEIRRDQGLREFAEAEADAGIPSGRRLAPLATARALPTVNFTVDRSVRDPRVRSGDVVLYQPPDQNALHNALPGSHG